MKANCFHRFGSPEELAVENFPVAMGRHVSDFAIGDAVIPLNDKRNGSALAEYCVMKAEYCCLAPINLDLTTVVVVPEYALTAIQVFIESAPVQPG